MLGLIGAPAAAQGARPPAARPGVGADVAAGLADAGPERGVAHPTLDAWWRERGFRGDVNHLPILMIDGFFDVESRGAFQAYQALRGDGAHLSSIGAHDGALGMRLAGPMSSASTTGLSSRRVHRDEE